MVVKHLTVVAILVGALLLMVSVAAAQSYGYVAVPFGLNSLVEVGGSGNFDDGVCSHDEISIRCWASFSGAGGNAWLVLTRLDAGLSGSVAGIAVDVFYRTPDISSGDWRIYGQGANYWIVPASSSGRNITVCAYNGVEVSDVAALAGIHCDYSLQNNGLTNVGANIALGVGSQGSSGTIEATLYNFRYIVSEGVLPTPTPMPTPAPAITSTIHSVSLPSGAVATVPMEVSAGQIIVIGAIGFLITLHLWEVARGLVHMVSKR